MTSATSEDMTASEPSRLQKLPGELRNRIYELAMPELADRRVTYLSKSRSLERGVRQPPLTRTCKQFRNQGLHYFYANLWVFEAYEISGEPADGHPIYKWLKAIGVRNRSRLGRIYVTVGGAKKAREVVDRCAWFDGRMEFAPTSTEERRECKRVWPWLDRVIDADVQRIKFL
ncbi:hypothetical protein LTR37_008419 [Vermiconidia calcicola]|uniref:Uncharacterized protein n=1 Tax=Vermiconidia calcicola TaxID=1690605 RepID=A0ACC3NAK8_9PEZI|nr:hypothetical protein LTR37_008419 [Vermiconidia calcicola]